MNWPAHENASKCRGKDEEDVDNDQGPETGDDQTVGRAQLQKCDQERDLDKAEDRVVDGVVNISPLRSVRLAWLKPYSITRIVSAYLHTRRQLSSQLPQGCLSHDNPSKILGPLESN